MKWNRHSLAGVLWAIALGGTACAPAPARFAPALPPGRPDLVRHQAKYQADQAVKPYLATPHTVGLVVGIVKGDVDVVVGYGKVAAGHDAAPDGRTIFEIGPITRVFTGVLLADMTKAGLVGLDDPLATCLPEGVKVPSRGGKPITLAELAMHTSGLPDLPDDFMLSVQDLRDPYAYYPVENVYRFLSRYRLLRDPGRKYEYSALGMGLLGLALAGKSQMSYEQALRRHICRKLGMDATCVILPAELRGRLAIGHGKDGRRTPYWNMPALPGAGALKSSAEDLLKFLRANMGLTPTELSDVLEVCQRPRAPADHPAVQAGLGWHLRPMGATGRQIVWHGGCTGGFAAWIGFVRETRAGVVVLSNSAHPVDGIALDLLTRLDAMKPSGGDSPQGP